MSFCVPFDYSCVCNPMYIFFFSFPHNMYCSSFFILCSSWGLILHSITSWHLLLMSRHNVLGLYRAVTVWRYRNRAIFLTICYTYSPMTLFLVHYPIYALLSFFCFVLCYHATLSPISLMWLLNHSQPDILTISLIGTVDRIFLLSLGI